MGLTTITLPDPDVVITREKKKVPAIDSSLEKAVFEGSTRRV